MKRWFYEYFGLDKIRFVPWAVELVLLPVILLFAYWKYGRGVEFGSVATFMCNLLLPMFAAWWNIFILQQYVESDGNEIYFFYKKSKLGTVLKYLLLYCIPVFILIAIAGFGSSLLWLELPGILIACAFVNGFAYLFLMFVPSSIVAILLCTLYPVYVIYFYNGGFCWFIYCYRQAVSKEMVMQGLLPMLIATVCMFMIGYERNLQKKTY